MMFECACFEKVRGEANISDANIRVLFVFVLRIRKMFTPVLPPPTDASRYASLSVEHRRVSIEPVNYDTIRPELSPEGEFTAQAYWFLPNEEERKVITVYCNHHNLYLRVVVCGRACVCAYAREFGCLDTMCVYRHIVMKGCVHVCICKWWCYCHACLLAQLFLSMTYDQRSQKCGTDMKVAKQLQQAATTVTVDTAVKVPVLGPPTTTEDGGKVEVSSTVAGTVASADAGAVACAVAVAGAVAVALQTDRNYPVVRTPSDLAALASKKKVAPPPPPQ